MKIPVEIWNTLPDLVKQFYEKWADFMDKNIHFGLYDSDFHTHSHAKRVLLHSLRLGYEIFGEETLPLEILSHAAIFHDTRRENDFIDPNHGFRGAEYYREFCENNDLKFSEEAFYLIYFHNSDDAESIAQMREKWHEKADFWIKLYQIFKDADALDRFRLGKRGFDAHFLRTENAKNSINFAKELVLKTIDNQTLAETERKVEAFLRNRERHR